MVAKAIPIPPRKNYKAKTTYFIYSIHIAHQTALKSNEKGLEWRYKTTDLTLTDAVIDRYATTAARRLNFLI